MPDAEQNLPNPPSAHAWPWAITSGVVAVSLGVAVLVGWMQDIAVLKSVLPGLVTMKPNSAAGIVLLGMGVVLRAWPRPGRVRAWAARTLVSAAGGIGVLTLSQYILDWDLGIDSLLFSEPAGAVLTTDPGRMSPLAAAYFVVFSGAVLLMGVGRCVAGTWLAIVAGLLAILPLDGYFLAAQILEKVPCTPVAAHESVVFLLLAAGALVGMPDRAPGLLPRIAFGFALVALVLAGYASFFNTQRMVETGAWVEEAHNTLARLEGVMANLQEIGAGTRGFVATGNEDFLLPIAAARDELARDLEASERLLQDSAQRDRLKELAPFITRRLEHADQSIRIRRTAGEAAALAHLARGRGEALVTAIRARHQEIERIERELLARHQEAASASNRSTLVTLGFTGLISVGVLVAFAITVHSWNAELEARVRIRTGQLTRANRAVHILSESKQAAVRTRTEPEYLSHICRVVVDSGKHRMCWLAYADNDPAKPVRPMAHAGREQGYLQPLNLTMPEGERVEYPVLTAIRTVQPCIIQDIETDPRFGPWRAEALARGYVSVLALPLVLDARPFGALGIYAALPNAFEEEETALWQEVASEVAQAVANLRTRAAREAAEAKLRREQEFTQALLQTAVDAVVACDGDGKLVLFNGTAREWHGLSPLDLPAEKWAGHYSLYRPDGRTPMATEEIPLLRAYRGETVQDVGMAIVRHGCPPRFVLANGAPFFDANGKMLGAVVVMRDITERKRMLETLQRSETELREAQRLAHLGSWDWEPETDAVTWTEEIYRIFGRDPQLPPPRLEEHRQVLTNDSFAQLEKAMTNTLRTGLSYELDLELLRPDGKNRWIQARGEAVHDETGRIVRLRGTALDITARKQAWEEICRLRADLERRVIERTTQLKQANEELESFSYSVSHDLRAPLRHVDGYIGLLKRECGDQLSEKARRFLQTIADATTDMSALIDDLLAFSRMSRLTIEEGEVDLNRLIKECIRSLESSTRDRKIDWQIPLLPRVAGDPSMLKQVLINLLGNAVKYTRPRTPARIEVGCQGEEDGRLVLFVSDNGVGFDPQYEHKLFGVFQRLHRAEEFEGNGIGLAIVRRIIARHGGRTWAQSVLNEGAKFFFTLKRAESQSHN